MRKKLVSLIFLIFFCKQEDLKIKKIELCEYFNSSGECKKELSEFHTYNFVIKEKKITTWEELANSMYFHSRETPGFIIRFNRSFTAEEKIDFKRKYNAEYSFSSVEGKMEGFEIGENWIGSFQYLGSIIKQRQKKFKLLEKKISKNLFPADLNMKFQINEFEGEIKTNINLIIE